MTRPGAAPLPDLVPTKGPLTAADVRKLYAAGRFEEIEAARLAGRLNDLLDGRPPRQTAT